MGASVQRRPQGAGDLEWETWSSVLLLDVSVEESGGFRATWSGSIALPDVAPDHPGLRRPGDADSLWRALVEEHELLDADPTVPGADAARVPRLVYADAVSL